MPGYDGSLLRLAVDLADRFMPAFDTPTRIPLSWVNLRKVGGGLAGGWQWERLGCKQRLGILGVWEPPASGDEAGVAPAAPAAAQALAANPLGRPPSAALP